MKRNINKLLSQMTVDEKIGQLIQLNPTFFADVSAYVTGPWEELGIDEDFLKNTGSVLGCKNAAEMIMIQEKHMALFSLAEKMKPLLKKGRRFMKRLPLIPARPIRTILNAFMACCLRG